MERGTARALLGAVLPKPGEGPSEASMANGWFKTDLIGRTADGRTAPCTHRLRRRPGQPCDAAYPLRSGLALAFDGAEAAWRTKARRGIDAGDRDR